MAEIVRLIINLFKIHGVGTRTVVTVTQGYSVTNGLSVGGGIDYTWTKDVLKGALNIDYSYSWSTTYQAAMAYDVTEGYSGTVVTKPTVTRKYGRILKGCIGAQVSTVLSSFLTYLVILTDSIYGRLPKALSKQPPTWKASAAVLRGFRATSASAKRRSPMASLFLVATEAATLSRS